MLRIRKLTATFGKLENRSLELHDGLNVISGGNEAGKTTWTEFILAMFYGVDTRARARGNRLPVKTLYLPWSGSPMSGRMELDRDGEALILERASGSAPLSELSVRDGAGNPVQALECANCGEQLLGVEAEVYRRSGCLRQQQAHVSAEPLLEKRLSGLVTAGSEDYSCAELDRRLKKLQNSIQYNQTGELPRLQAASSELAQTLKKAEDLQQQLARLEARIAQSQASEAELSEISEGLVRREQQLLYKTILETRSALDQAEEELRSRESVCAELPSSDIQQELRLELNRLREEERIVRTEAALDSPAAPLPPKEPAFFDLTAQQAVDKAREDAEFVSAHLSPTNKPLLWLLLLLPGLAALAAGALLFFSGAEHRLLAGILAAVGLLFAVCGIVLCIRSRNAAQAARQNAEKLLVWYEADSAAGILEKAGGYVKALQLFEAQQEENARRLSRRRDRAAVVTAGVDALLARFRKYAPDCDSPDRAEAFLQQAAFSTAALEQAKKLSLQRRTALERLEQQLRFIPDLNEDLDRYRDYAPDTVRADLEACRTELQQLRAEAGRISGVLEELGDPYALRAELEEKQARMSALQQRLDALVLARAVLTEADESLRSRFSPLLCRRTGKILSQFTDGKYDRITLDREFNIRVHAAGSITDRPLSYFSGGTVDQLYLALRLAICDLLLPDAPIILDDALVYFDDARAEQALKGLRDLGKTRQILLFTCQSREKRILDGLRADQGQT